MSIPSNSIDSGVLLLDHMKCHGFDETWFGSGAMIDVHKNSWGRYEAVFRPVGDGRTSHRFSLTEILHIGDALKFPAEMLSMAETPHTIWSALCKLPFHPISAIFGLTLAIGSNFFSSLKWSNEMSIIEGLICQNSNPPASIFPVDEWLQIRGIDTFCLDLQDQEGRVWRIGKEALLHYTYLRFKRLEVAI